MTVRLLMPLGEIEGDAKARLTMVCLPMPLGETEEERSQRMPPLDGT